MEAECKEGPADLAVCSVSVADVEDMVVKVGQMEEAMGAAS